MTKLGIIGAMDIEVAALKENMGELTITKKAGICRVGVRRVLRCKRGMGSLGDQS